MLESYQKYSDEELAALSKNLERAALNTSAPWYFHALWIVGCIVGIGGAAMLMGRAHVIEQVAVIGGLLCLLAAYLMERDMSRSREICLRRYQETAKEIDRRRGNW